MESKSGLTQELIAKRVVQEFYDGCYVNPGFGIPSHIMNVLPEGKEIFLQGENGILGYGPVPEKDKQDAECINPSAVPMSLMPGASFTDTSISFGMMRGKHHLDFAVLGVYQVSEKGDLANWAVPWRKAGGIGGAMDMVVGAKTVFVTTLHTDKLGKPRIVKECSYPLTAKGVVNTIFTNLAVIEVTPQGLLLKEIAPGFTPPEVQAVTEPKLLISSDLKEIEV